MKPNILLHFNRNFFPIKIYILKGVSILNLLYKLKKTELLYEIKVKCIQIHKIIYYLTKDS
jgi:hypothetical protein